MSPSTAWQWVPLGVLIGFFAGVPAMIGGLYHWRVGPLDPPTALGDAGYVVEWEAGQRQPPPLGQNNGECWYARALDTRVCALWYDDGRSAIDAVNHRPPSALGTVHGRVLYFIDGPEAVKVHDLLVEG